MLKKIQRLPAFILGAVFLVVLAVLSLVVDDPTSFQYLVFRILLAIAAAGVAAMIPGFLAVSVSNWLRAGGER